MLIISTSGKTLDLKSKVPVAVPSKLPVFLKEAEALRADLAKLSLPELKRVLGVSEEIALVNFERLQGWSQAVERPVLFMYKGDVFKELHPFDYSPQQLNYAESHLFVMSGLYGAVGALERIKPYRLEMKAQLQGLGMMSKFWQKKVTDFLNEKAAREGHELLLNLASKEYAAAVNPKALKIPMLTVEFRETQKNGESKIVPIFSKKARGMMIDFCIQNQIENPADLKAFDRAGYRYAGEAKGVISFVR